MLRISADGLAWQSKQGGQEVVNGSDLRAATWLALGRTFQLKLALKGGSVVKFDGFPPKVRAANRGETSFFRFFFSFFFCGFFFPSKMRE